MFGKFFRAIRAKKTLAKGDLRGKPSVGQFDHKRCISNLDSQMQPFTDSFFDKLCVRLPTDFCLDYDTKAPENVPHETERNGHSQTQKISLEINKRKHGKAYKYGTGRVEMRGRNVFAKTVTWRTPKSFLFQRKVYKTIKSHFQDHSVVRNQSKTGNGFAIKNPRQRVTLEVFGSNPQSGFLACDVTFNRGNPLVARERLSAFLDFYTELYNLVNNRELQFQLDTPSGTDLGILGDPT